MAECRIITTTDLPRRRRSSQPEQFPTPSSSPSGTASNSGLEEDDDKENNLSAHERMPQSPTDKLLSPVSRALKAQKKSPKRGVRTSLMSLADVAA